MWVECAQPEPKAAASSLPTFDFMYAAITARDTRFDGQFYTAVTSTKIYCRPSCPAVKPRQQNVVFYATAAGAQAAGFRACLRCIPDAAPGSPLWNAQSSIAHRAMRLIEDGVVDRDGVTGLAARLGYTARHLNRMLVAEFGASILALARAHRAQTARRLLTETDTQITQIAYLSGFSSVREFNTAMQQIFSQTPSEIRARSKHAPKAAAHPGEITLTLPYRAPFNFEHLLESFALRSIDGVELVEAASYTRSLSLPHGPALATVRDGSGSIELTLQYAHVSDLSAAVSRVRRMLDLDADPLAVQETLGTDPTMASAIRSRPGLRIPGSVDPHETLFRALIEQDTSPAAASEQLARIAACTPALGFSGRVNRLFPAATAIAATGPEMLRSHPRQEALRIAAERLLRQPDSIDFARDQGSLINTLLSFKGVSSQTAAHVATAILGAPDIFVPEEAAMRAGAARLKVAGSATPESLAEFASRFQPWRSYLALHLRSAAVSRETQPQP